MDTLFDGYNALAISGARIDPAYYLAQCSTPDATTEAILTSSSPFSCFPADEAVAFFGYHLQNRVDLAWYFSADFVAQHDDLAWGEYAHK